MRIVKIDPINVVINLKKNRNGILTVNTEKMFTDPQTFWSTYSLLKLKSFLFKLHSYLIQNLSPMSFNFSMAWSTATESKYKVHTQEVS
jgi:hypothetical protein